MGKALGLPQLLITSFLSNFTLRLVFGAAEYAACRSVELSCFLGRQAHREAAGAGLRGLAYVLPHHKEGDRGRAGWPSSLTHHVEDAWSWTTTAEGPGGRGDSVAECGRAGQKLSCPGPGKANIPISSGASFLGV